MAIDSIYLGTWLPRTHIHLGEIHKFLRTGLAENLDPQKTKELHKNLDVKKLTFKNNKDLDSVEFSSHEITTTITEDGVILLKLDKTDDIKAGAKNIESFYTESLGPTLTYLFSKGAPLPQTLVDIKEAYPTIFVGEHITEGEIKAIFDSRNEDSFMHTSSQNLGIFYGEQTEVIKILRSEARSLFESFITNFIFTKAYSDLLRRYLIAHRLVWDEISSIKEAPGLRYKDFHQIRNKILDSMKTISFIQARLNQMTEILSSRGSIAPDKLKQTFTVLGLESFVVLESSSRYFVSLWQMTSDYANSTLKLFESLVEENSQRELRLLQLVTVAGVLVGFFGMNIAFPWEERWGDIFSSSLVVIGIILASLIFFYQMLRKTIQGRRFN